MLSWSKPVYAVINARLSISWRGIRRWCVGRRNGLVVRCVIAWRGRFVCEVGLRCDRGLRRQGWRDVLRVRIGGLRFDMRRFRR